MQKSNPNYLLRTRHLTIFKEAPGVISPGPLWVCYEKYYMYTGKTFFGLLRNMWKNWRNDNSIVG